LLDERDAIFLVVLDAEAFQALIAFLNIGVARARKIATADVGARQRVADARRGAVVGLQKLLLLGLRQLGKGLGRSISECPADTKERLVRVARVYKHAYLRFERLRGRLKTERRPRS
jgi:hypothetical protein